jgi:RNA polymerase sigma-70 factor (ECF subfamily)
VRDDHEDLIDRASRGDAAAVDVLLTRNLAGLEAYVRLRAGRMIRSRESASDLVQSVCREVLEHMDRYQYRGEAQFRQWLYTTAMRKISNRADYYQAEKRDFRKETPLAPDRDSRTSPDPALLAAYRNVASPSRHLAAREELERVERAFGELPEDKREVILLAKIVGLSREQIAAQIGRTEPAVRSLLSRALAELAERLDDGAGEGDGGSGSGGA